MPSIDIVIEAVQFTPDRDPVIVQFCEHQGTSGPFATSHQLHTTQPDLIAKSAAPGYWSDAEVKAALADYLRSHGVDAVIVPNVEAIPEPPETPA